jgi:hypothetical protein
VWAQVRWLGEIGFEGADCRWKWREFALLGGSRLPSGWLQCVAGRVRLVVVSSVVEHHSRYLHVANIATPDDVDDALCELLAEAYEDTVG